MVTRCYKARFSGSVIPEESKERVLLEKHKMLQACLQQPGMPEVKEEDMVYRW